MKRSLSAPLPTLLGFALLLTSTSACKEKAEDTGGASADESGSEDGDAGDTSAGDASADGDASASGDGDGDADASASGDGDADTGDAGDGTTGALEPEVECGNTVYDCGDGMDNDGDGLVDGQDPECTGPCDDDEGSFQTGISGDNVDCKQDCFFDGNSGHGEGCTWDLVCDPANPGADVGCPYDPNKPNCSDQSSQPDSCLEACLPLVPNGCDCFGCCSVNTDEGEIWIFLNSSPDCALDNLEACTTCTPNEDCSNECTPDTCEVCFGGELPPECEEPSCDTELPCETSADCPESWYCTTGCCFPPPEG